MADLKFADTHNLVSFLSKLAESEGFEQIVDFLNAKPVNYALTVNPTIYTSYIKQLWATVKVKTVNGEVQLQALVDGKKIVITESTIRIDLQLEDAEGTDCLPNATIFEQLTLMGAKTTAWNEFSSTMASAVICLATNQKFNFSKYILESMVKNLENVSGKFWMYLRFVQVFVNQQVGNMSNHKRIYVTPSHTKKIFRNMKREGKGFSGRVTLLFPTIMVQAQEEMGEGLANPTDPHHTPIITQPSHHNPRRNKNLGSQRERTLRINGFLYQITKKVLDLENTKTAQAQEISSLKPRVKKLEKKEGSITHKLKRLYMVGLSRRIESSDEASLDEEDASKQERKIHDIDANENITLENVHDAEMFDVNDDLHGDEVFVEKKVPIKEVSDVGKVNTASIATTVSAATITEVDITLAQALAELKNTRPKAKGLVIHEEE
ncbi:hypothetical protein Tco_1448309 [Tanacetum coccineum]